MLLKSLKLKDFRQFKGEQEITFSTDPVPVKLLLLKHLPGAFMGTLTSMTSLCYARQLHNRCYRETRRRSV